MINSAHVSAGRLTRRGTVVPLLALTVVALVAFLALAIDLGMLAVAKTQVQQAADLAALTASRSINGSATNNYNQSTATTNAQNVLGYNVILGQKIQSSQLTLTYGSYDYNQTSQTFNANYPATSGQPYTAIAATVTANSLPAAFSTIFGQQFLPSVSATAQAVHRPRDIALVMDLSGSMRLGTCLGFDPLPTSLQYNRTSNNPDTNVPAFGHYSSSSAGLVYSGATQTSATSSYSVPPTNTTLASTSYTLTYINNFYQNAAYASTLVRAFDSYTSTDGGNTWIAPTSGSPQLPPSSYATVPGGDVPLWKNGGTTTYAQHVQDVVGSSSRNKWWELDGYSGDTSGSFNNTDLGTSSYTSGSFNAYTQGPGYYGKTFFSWPPDPRRPLNTGTATAWSTTTADATTINQFLQDFGYGTSTDFANAAFTTTWKPSANVSTSATSITFASTPTGFPVSGLPTTTFQVVISTGGTNKEIMTVTAASGTTWTVSRGQAGTTAQSYFSTTTYTVGLVTASPLYGIYGASVPFGNSTSGSQTWPWPNDSGATLSTYLTTKVYAPVTVASTARFLQTTDAVYQRIMRLYNWNYVVDNYNSAGTGSTYPGTTPCDWRIRFFGTNDNTKLFNSSNGSLNLPGASTYTINYNEILRWLATTPNPFPQQLRGGRIKYYGSIPTAITGSYPSYGSTDQRFWVEFINYVLGFCQTGSTTYVDLSGAGSSYQQIGYGGDFTWGTKSINSPPSSTQYVNYSDNPARGKLRFWFSPILLSDYLQNYNLGDLNLNGIVSGYFLKQAGDTYEAPTYVAKQAYVAAVSTMQTDHPNDWVTVVPYSWPRSGSSGAAAYSTSFGRFNCVSSPLGNNYNYATSALLFPFSTINADGSPNNTEITPYDADPATGKIPSANLVDTPRADGDTCFAMALMLCYNQFAVTPSNDTTLRTFVTNTPITFPTGMAGGMGRKGAQKVIIFETDGLPNCAATVNSNTPVSAGSYSYFPIRYDMNRPTSSEYPAVQAYGDINDSAVTSQITSLVTTLKSTYGTTRNPFRLYTIGFGPVFSGPNANAGLSTLQSMQYTAGMPGQTTASTALPSNQVIAGNLTGAQMSTNLVSIFTTILQSGVQIALIK